ncbi:hypothetical protein, partial [Paenibacillus kobensis]|uniref:hypothetical protein n=1 Tax=Paenibacillus kobensis TaxID=59841 RepID=UPI001C3F9A76
WGSLNLYRTTSLHLIQRKISPSAKKPWICLNPWISIVRNTTGRGSSKDTVLFRCINYKEEKSGEVEVEVEAPWGNPRSGRCIRSLRCRSG